MTLRSYEERVRLRLMMENPGIAHDIEVGEVVDPAIDGRRYIEGDDAARIAALEYQDTVDPLSHLVTAEQTNHQCPACGEFLDNARRLRNHIVVCAAEKRLQELYDAAKASGMSARQAHEVSITRFQVEQEVSR